MSQNAILDFREILGAMACIVFLGNSVAWSQAPTNPPDRLPPHGVPDSHERDARETIRRTLNGESVQTPQDGVLQDVLGVIRNQGSVLDESELDPRKSDASNLPRLAGPPPWSNRTLDVHPTGISHPTRSISKEKANAAEHLLKAARLLSAIPGAENDPLIFQLRSKAAELLLR